MNQQLRKLEGKNEDVFAAVSAEEKQKRKVRRRRSRGGDRRKRSVSAGESPRRLLWRN